MVLTQKRNLIAAGSAYDIWKMPGRLEPFDVYYEIKTEYPYEWKMDGKVGDNLDTAGITSCIPGNSDNG